MKNKLPKYVKLGYSALRLVNKQFSENNNIPYNQYYRDAGFWWVGHKWINNKLYSVSDIEWLDNIELIEITKEEWKEDNKGYI